MGYLNLAVINSGGIGNGLRTAVMCGGRGREREGGEESKDKVREGVRDREWREGGKETTMKRVREERNMERQ